MLYIFMGQSCTGKSTIANKVKELTGAEIFTGKDYLRMAKNEKEAWGLFHEMMSNAASNEGETNEAIIYVITEKAQLDRIIDIKDSFKVKFNTPLDTIKLRFAKRMNGNLPQPVEKMLEKQYEEWKFIDGDVNVDSSEENDIEKIVNLILR